MPGAAGGRDRARSARPCGHAASLYDLDGTLVRGNIVNHYLFYALTDAGVSSRALRFAGAALRAPLWLALDRLDRRAFNEAFYRSFAGFSEDRLRILGRDLFERVVRPAIFPGARDLVAGDRAAGHLTVLVSGALDLVAEPVARHLGIERVAANRLVFDADGRATGALEPPVLAGPEKAAWVRRFAAEEGIDLERSRAYADDAADLPFLSSVGRPVAVRPDARLRATALAHGWPILDLSMNERSFGDRVDGLLDGALSVLRLLEAKR